MSALIDAIKNDQEQRALESVQNDDIREKAAANDNEALRLAGGRGHLSSGFRIIKGEIGLR